MKLVAPQPLRQVPASRERQRAGRAAILVVDDDRATQRALTALLEDLGQPVVCAGSGEAALRQLLERDFAVVLLDVLMPGMDGYETAAMIRARPRCRHLPIIFLSAVNKDEGHMFKGYSAGAVDYVFKPVEPLILRSKVAVFIDLHNKAEAIRKQAEAEKRLLAENLRVRTEQMQTVQALRRSEARQALIIDSLPIALYVAEPGPAVRSRRFVSENVEQISGFPAERFAADPDLWASRLHESDHDHVLDALARLGQEGHFASEYRWRCADGEYRYFLDRAVLVRDRYAGQQEVFGSFLDVTERRQLEQQLTHAHKMEALGQLTGGIAHDFNNMLTVIIGNLDRVRRQLDAETNLGRRVERALQGALSCSDLTKRLLGFARGQPLQVRPLDLNKQVKNLAELLDRTLSSQVEFEFRCAENLWPVLSDPSPLESALVNLVINARDAMPDGGRITIATGNRSFDATTAPSDLPPGDYVELSVADTGVGMTPEVMQRVFDPFFTTKPPGKGTGLGLSTLYGFVKQSGGRVEIDSTPGRGTTIRLLLPRAAEAAAGSGPAGTVEDPGEASILLVEDDPNVRALAATTLRDCGYRLQEAANASAALEILQANGEIDLLFTDWLLGGDMDGHQLAERARQLRPDLVVVYTSAHGDGFLADLAAGQPRHFLPKPYRDDALIGIVRTALRQRARG